MRLLKLKASALQFAILVSVIIALMLASFLTLTKTQRFFEVQSDIFLSVITASREGVNYSLQKQIEISDSLALEIDNIPTTIKKAYWGSYELISAESKLKTKLFVSKALIGTSAKKNKIALQFGNTDLPLVLVGDTKIVGDVKVSSKGVKSGVIAGTYFNGDMLIEGNILTNSFGLPKLSEGFSDYLENALAFIPVSKDVVFDSEDIYTNSFLEPTAYRYSKNKIMLTQELTGNIIIKSEDEIIINKYAKLQDVLVIAPKVTIEEGFSDNIHIIASEEIIIEENVALIYPSSVVVKYRQKEVAPSDTPPNSPIEISKGSSIQGNVMFLAEELPENYSDSSILLEKEAAITGSIFCEGNTVLKGVVRGSVFTQKFLVNAEGSRYINHIFGGEIRSNKLPKSFGGLPLKRASKEIAQWMY